MLAGAGDQDVHSGIAQLRVSRCKVPSAVGKLYSVKQLKACKVVLLDKFLHGPDPGSCRRKTLMVIGKTLPFTCFPGVGAGVDGAERVRRHVPAIAVCLLFGIWI